MKTITEILKEIESLRVKLWVCVDAIEADNNYGIENMRQETINHFSTDLELPQSFSRKDLENVESSLIDKIDNLEKKLLEMGFNREESFVLPDDTLPF